MTFHRSARLFLLAMPALLLPTGVLAQKTVKYDPSIAFLADTTTFVPFQVVRTRPLRQALADRQLDGDTPVLVLEHPAGRLALITDQMAYHHVAQGDLAGHPWMVSF